MSKLRLQHFVIQPVLLVDDGGDELPTLTPPIPPQALSLAELHKLLRDWPDQLAALQEQWDAVRPKLKTRTRPKR
jgi:hypothetical protein